MDDIRLICYEQNQKQSMEKRVQVLKLASRGGSTIFSRGRIFKKFDKFEDFL